MSLASLHPSFRPWAQALYIGAERSGMRPRVTSTFRSSREQAILFERRQRVLRGELPPSAQAFPVAPPGRSRHNFAAAFDMVVDAGDERVVGSVWRTWGGFWTSGDRVHYGDVG